MLGVGACQACQGVLGGLGPSFFWLRARNVPDFFKKQSYFKAVVNRHLVLAQRDSLFCQ